VHIGKRRCTPVPQASRSGTKLASYRYSVRCGQIYHLNGDGAVRADFVRIRS